MEGECIGTREMILELAIQQEHILAKYEKAQNTTSPRAIQDLL